jgi:hypothetical protein
MRRDATKGPARTRGASYNDTTDCVRNCVTFTPLDATTILPKDADPPLLPCTCAIMLPNVNALCRGEGYPQAQQTTKIIIFVMAITVPQANLFHKEQHKSLGLGMVRVTR